MPEKMMLMLSGV